MRLVRIEHLRGDEILGKQLYDDTGRVLLSQGVILTPFYINKLKQLGINALYIKDEISQEIVVEDNISEQTRQVSKAAIKDMMDRYSQHGKLHNEGIVKSVNAIIDDVLATKDVMVNVAEIRSSSENLYTHSVNVTVLSTILGIHMGYNQLRLKELAVGSILHDIGKARILLDKKELEKTRTQDEMNLYIQQQHPKVGFEFLSHENFCSAVSKVAVLMHHEKVDGSGYPLHLTGKDINEVAKIVAVCNSFDNMVSGIGETGPMPVYQVLEYLVAMSGRFYDAEVVKRFIGNIAAFPTGSAVILNTGERCLVIRQNQGMPMRPVVKVVYNKNGVPVNQSYEIDLEQELTQFINQTIDM
ncbi:MAG: HD-GYP domain-containing protein [Solirubrobacterales bacterium]